MTSLRKIKKIIAMNRKWHLHFAKFGRLNPELDEYEQGRSAFRSLDKLKRQNAESWIDVYNKRVNYEHPYGQHVTYRRPKHWNIKDAQKAYNRYQYAVLACALAKEEAEFDGSNYDASTAVPLISESHNAKFRNYGHPFVNDYDEYKHITS